MDETIGHLEIAPLLAGTVAHQDEALGGIAKAPHLGLHLCPRHPQVVSRHGTRAQSLGEAAHDLAAGTGKAGEDHDGLPVRATARGRGQQLLQQAHPALGARLGRGAHHGTENRLFSGKERDSSYRLGRARLKVHRAGVGHMTGKPRLRYRPQHLRPCARALEKDAAEPGELRVHRVMPFGRSIGNRGERSHPPLVQQPVQRFPFVIQVELRHHLAEHLRVTAARQRSIGSGTPAASEHPPVKTVGLTHVPPDSAHGLLALGRIGSRDDRFQDALDKAFQVGVAGERGAEALRRPPEHERRRPLRQGQEKPSGLLALLDATPEGIEVVQAVYGWIQEVEHRQEIVLVVERGRSGKKQQPLRAVGQRGQPGERLARVGIGGPGQRGQVVCLIDDEESESGIGVPAVERVGPREAHAAAELAYPELVFQLFTPLLHQERRCDDERPSAWIVEQELPDDDPRLDRLPQPHFVSQEVPLHGVFQHAPHDFHLVRQNANPRGKEAGEPTRTCTLAQERADESTSVQVEERRFVSVRSKRLHRVGQRRSAAHVDCALLHIPRALVREEHLVLGVHPVADSARKPSSRLSVFHIAAMLRCQPGTLQRA
jgi:hypothetical protein